MRNYLMIEKTDGVVELSVGTGKEVPKEESIITGTYWNVWEKMETEEMLFKRIKELIYK